MATTTKTLHGTAREIIAYLSAIDDESRFVLTPETIPIDPKNARAIAYLQEILQRPTPSPEEIAEAEREQRELLEQLNQNRLDAGEEPLWPA